MMFKRNPAIAAVTAAAIALTTGGTTAPAFAASKPQTELQTAKVQEATEFSSRKRHRHYRHRHRNNAAAAAAFSAIVGGIAAYAAAREYRKARERGYYRGYYGGPYGYYGGPGYYRW